MEKLRLALVASVMVVLAACGAGDADDNTSDETPQEVDLTVFAAASLRATFTEIGELFEEQNEAVTVTFNFAGSSDLVAQIDQGAPADVFASADTANMDKAVAGDSLGSDPVDFATNTLQIGTPPGNPANVTSFADLASDDLRLVICAPQVPCGAASQKVAKGANITLRPVSEENSVTDVLGKVQSGDADAGLVYVTDAVNAGDTVESIAFDESSAVVNLYPIAVVKDSKHADLAQAFVDLVTSAEGQAILAAAGFGTP